MDAQEFFDKVSKTLEPLKSLKPLQKDPDLVKVVRCRDCRSWWPDTNEENCSSGLCRNQFGVCGGQTTDMNWFCADGERANET
jgi:hypothetical protein